MAFGTLWVRYDPVGLRPRPWTTLQSAWAADLLPRLPPGDVLELCAGPGQIGLLALVQSSSAGARDRSERRRLVQVDKDETACRLARRNAEAAGLGDRVEVRRGWAEESLRPDEQFALVIADPPWVPTHRVADYPDDPPAAVDGGTDGLDVVRALLPVIERHVHPTGAGLLQVGGPEQVEAVRAVLSSTGSTLCVAESREAPSGQNGAVALLVHQ